MAIDVLESRLPDGTPCAVLFDSVTYWTMAPIFVDRAEALAFLAHVRRVHGVEDPRVIGTKPLDDAFLQFVTSIRPRSAAWTKRSTRRPYVRAETTSPRRRKVR